MGKIKLVSDGHLPQTLPTGGILMNDGDPIDFSALGNGSGSNPCDDPNAAYIYVVNSYVEGQPTAPGTATVLLRATSFILDDGSEIINESSRLSGFEGTLGDAYYRISCQENIYDRVGVIKIKVASEEIVEGDYGPEFTGFTIPGNFFLNLEEAMEYAINNNVVIYQSQAE